MKIDINTIQELITAAAWVVPVITAIVHVIKSTFENSLNTRYIPLLSVVIGILMGLILMGFTLIGGFAGLIFGLTASGFYDLGKKTVAGN